MSSVKTNPSGKYQLMQPMSLLWQLFLSVETSFLSAISILTKIVPQIANTISVSVVDLVKGIFNFLSIVPMTLDTILALVSSLYKACIDFTNVVLNSTVQIISDVLEIAVAIVEIPKFLTNLALYA